MKVFEPLKLNTTVFPNRFFRSATFENMADADGTPLEILGDLYNNLARNGVGTIITGFCYISKQGRAMHPYQTGMDDDNKTAAWQKIVSRAKAANPDTRLVMQLAHAGRQTMRAMTGEEVVGAGGKRCTYFKQSARALRDHEIESIIRAFAAAAKRARKAGFDGVQIHAAHGYLIHQFLSIHTNRRKDKWGNDKTLFLRKVLEVVRNECGADFPILLKISHSDDRDLATGDAIETLKSVERLVDAVEVSYGTMEYALNIFRGDCPIDVALRVNPLFNKIPGVFRKIWKKFFLGKYLRAFMPFSENYNLEGALQIKEAVDMPVIVVGGIRNFADVEQTIQALDGVALCRPLIAEPDLVLRIKQGERWVSRCTNCNMCAINCDSKNHLRCYKGKENAKTKF